MRKTIQFTILQLALYCQLSAFAQTNITSFFNNLFTEFRIHYIETDLDLFQTLCKKYDLNMRDIQSENKFYQLYFFHDLFTSNSASNFETGGLLNIPYFWHWVEPNPRHSIIFLADSVKLSTVKPPKEFSRYKSYADIDRIPVLYLSDLVTENPKFYHSQCGYFYTFGWCSEREMAFNCLLSLFGYTTKIKQSGIHTWSEILISFSKIDGSEQIFTVKIDNTFDRILWIPIKENMTELEWKSDIGDGSEIEWYNKKATSREQMNQVSNIEVSMKSQHRIKKLIETKLKSITH